MKASSFPRICFGSRLLIAASLFGYVHTLSSCAPPRFDVFSAKVVGSWYTNVPAQDYVQVADEVRRSCGGAVQGVRDVPLVSSSLYLNRADDGFVFFDCGSYTHGPVALSGDPQASVMTTNFMLSSTSRLLLSCTLDRRARVAKILKASVLHQVSFGDDGSSLEPNDFACAEMDDSIHRLLGISWTKHQQCRMSSPSQPWMLQRAQWEAKGSRESPLLGTFDDLRAWTDVQAAGAGVREDTDFADNTTTVSGLVVTMGVMCIKTGWVKAMIRKYNEDGKLETVALKSGRVEQS